MARKLIFWFLAISTLQSVAQSWQFVRKHDLGHQITVADGGALGKVYVGTSRGVVYSFHADGTPDTQFSSAVFQPVTSLDADNTLRVFVFYQSAGVFEFLERFSAFPRSYHLRDFGVSSAELAATGLNQTLWLLNGADLVQVNPINNSILQRMPVPSSINPSTIRSMNFAKEPLLLTDAGIYNLKTQDYLLRGAFLNMDRAEDEVIAWTGTDIRVVHVPSAAASSIEAPAAHFDWCIRTQSYFHFGKGQEVWVYRRLE